MPFTERLKIGLKVTANGTEHAIAGGDVKLVELDLAAYGFEGTVEFVVMDDSAEGGKEQDALLADFKLPALIEVALTLEAAYPSPETSKSIQPLSVKGIATRRSVEEPPTRERGDRAAVYRRYRVEFADPARVLWGQHHPCALYTQKSMKDVIDAHKGAKIAVTYDWEALTTAAPLLFLHLTPEHGASFYDFLLWYTDTRAGVFAYDYAAPGYALRAAKDASGTPAKLFGDDVGRARVMFPEVPRHSCNVLNAFAGAATTTAITNEQAQDEIRHDILLRAPVANDADDRVALETSRLIVRKSELQLEFARWPTITFHPGLLVDFVQANRWSAGALQVGVTHRVVSHTVRARSRAGGPDQEHLAPDAPYDVEVSARLEQKDEAWVHRPPYTRPTYPGYLEGKVVSEQGADEDITYQYYTDDQTSLDQYKVTVPLFADQVITAPYDPHQGSGKMYVPAYKGARVLLELTLERAAIARLLDWRDGVRMAQDAQGERLMFGKKIAAGTTVDHSYDDNKPVLLVTRTNDKDKATIKIQEGSLIIQVKEDQ